MENLLSLSRAAKLVGVTRGTLQQKIQDGEIESFEGQVRLEDLAHAYPDADIEHHNEMERYERIVEEALIRARYGKMQQLLTPDVATMTARAAALNKELLRIRGVFRNHLALIERLQDKLHHPGENQLDPSTAISLASWLETGLQEIAKHQNQVPYLVDKDTYLRVMTAHVRLMPSGHDFFVEGQDSILEAALHNGLAMEYGCNSGNCGLCKARVVSGDVKRIKHADYTISEAERLDNIILMCCNTPVNDITLEAPEATGSQDIPEQSIPVTIRKIEERDGIMILSTRTPRTQRLRFLAGQTVNVKFNNRLQAKLHIASCPCDDMNIQFHVPIVRGDEVSEYLQNDINKSDKLYITGPYGEFVIEDEPSNPLMFIAYDSGFAPIKGLIENALAQDTSQAIYLYRITRPGREHYMRNICRAWTDALDVFKYHELNAEPGDTAHIAEILKHHPNLKNYLVYLAGPRQWLDDSRKMFERFETQPAQLKAEPMLY
jgi:CDP-4-dehydro-6-deoxyglucose reductase